MKKTVSLILVALVCFGQVGCSSNLIDTVLNDLPIATDIATSVVDIVSPGNAGYIQEVTEYAGKVGADLKLMESLITQYRSNLAGAPSSTAAQISAAFSDAQSNLAAILQAVGVSDPKVTAAVAAAVASVKLILNDVALLLQQNAPPEVSTRLFFGVPGMELLAMGNSAKTQPAANSPAVHVELKSAAKGKPSGKSARQIAKEYNQKISKDFPKARVNVAKAHVLGIPIPLTGGK